MDQIKQSQDGERKQLAQLRDVLKNSLQSDQKEVRRPFFIQNSSLVYGLVHSMVYKSGLESGAATVMPRILIGVLRQGSERPSFPELSCESHTKCSTCFSSDSGLKEMHQAEWYVICHICHILLKVGC